MTIRIRVAALAALMMGTSASANTGGLHWIINGPALSYFAENSTARRYLTGARPFVIVRKDASVSLPAEWEAQEVRSFTSVAAMERVVNSGLGPSVRAVLYDNEHWQFTPQSEQLDPASSAQRAAQIAHRHGLQLIVAPAVDLVRALSPGTTGKTYDRFIELGVIGNVARSADVVVVQAQGSETALPLYTRFVDEAAQQARAANPRAIVLAGISTNPSGQHVTTGQILAAIRATRASVDGYWFNVPAPGPYCPKCNDFRPDIAVEVFSSLDGGL